MAAPAFVASTYQGRVRGSYWVVSLGGAVCAVGRVEPPGFRARATFRLDHAHDGRLAVRRVEVETLGDAQRFELAG